MTSEEIIRNYVNKFCDHFANEVKTESLVSELEQEALGFYNFSRTFEDQPDYVKQPDGKNLSEHQDLTSLEQIFKKKKKRLLLLGEPGTGKTVLLRSFAKNKGQEIRNNSNLILPIFAPIRRWNGEEDILNWLVNQAKIIDSEIDKNILKQQIKAKQVLLLLDGLDELPSNVTESQDPNAQPRDYRADFMSKLADFELEYGWNPTIVTCRHRDYKEIIDTDNTIKLNLNGAVILQQLSYKAIKNYLDNVFPKNSVFLNHLWTVLTKNLALLKMIRTPFILTVLVLPYLENTGNSKNEAEQLTAVGNTDQLFDKFIDKGYEREKKKKENSDITVPCSLDKLKQILGQVALLMMSDSRPDDNYIFRDIFERVLPQEDEIEKFIQFSQNLYLLVPTVNQEERTYRFRHLLLQDYFAFRYAYQFLQNDENGNSTTGNWRETLTKSQIAIALGKINRLRSTDLLIDLLKDPDKDVRYEAAKSLGELKAGVYFRGYRQDFSEPYLISQPMSGFDKQSIKEYFTKSVPKQPITDSEVEKIAEFSLGIPFVVNQVTTMWAKGYRLQEITDPVPKLIQSEWQTPHEQIIAATVNRFLIHCVKDKQDKQVVYLLAMMRRPDEKLLRSMLNVTDVKNRLENLYERYSFVLPEQLKLDENYGAFLTKYLLIPEQRNQPYVQEINSEAKLYFQNSLSSLTSNLITAQQRLENQEIRETISDLFHHKFWLEGEDKAWNDLIPYLIEGWRYNIEWALNLLKIAEQFTSTKDGKQRLQYFTQALVSSANELEQSKLLDELETIVNLTLENEDWKAIVLLQRCELLFNQKRYEEVIKKCLEAKEYIPEKAIDLKVWMKSLLDASEKFRQPEEIPGFGNSKDNVHQYLQNQFEKLSDILEKLYKQVQKNHETKPQIPPVIPKEPEPKAEKSPEVPQPSPKQPLEQISKQNILVISTAIIGFLLVTVSFLSGLLLATLLSR
ncbi:MAG: NACHT domain-containing protein [Nostocaceae cyanobacterium]|nr:NACHT domain-containing protein [Nostocaceae cyanobacterium]